MRRCVLSATRPGGLCSTSVEREFGVLKHEWAMLPLRVRRISRVRSMKERTWDDLPVGSASRDAH